MYSESGGARPRCHCCYITEAQLRPAPLPIAAMYDPDTPCSTMHSPFHQHRSDLLGECVSTVHCLVEAAGHPVVLCVAAGLAAFEAH